MNIKPKKQRPQSAFIPRYNKNESEKSNNVYISKKVRPSSALQLSTPSYMNPTYNSFHGKYPPPVETMLNKNLSTTPKKDIFIPKINKNQLFTKRPLPSDYNTNSGRTSPIISPSKKTKDDINELSFSSNSDEEILTKNTLRPRPVKKTLIFNQSSIRNKKRISRYDIIMPNKNKKLSEFSKFCILQLKDEDIDINFVKNIEKMGNDNKEEIINAISKYKGVDWLRKHLK